MSDARSFSCITGGTDRRIRYWDGVAPEMSYMISSAAGETLPDRKLFCRNYHVDGTDIIHEYQSSIRSMSTSASISASMMKEADTTSRSLVDSPFTGHSDIITDLVICSTANQLFIVSGSRDGIIKVWK
ncbi:phosphoinositide 3-kinase regulatory subunit 4-like [Paramacrobiotus metropolitanus]|uniref:phosphoinositide 3-kinase regulatory subunit 4-like n=1 Tax=Paramacrobiotus metropolitanus TaxID=2943436 RepID=UPI0024456C53|nr:phosphoinositide 3-kinase regulatory subunit 4-like [Paramacrobiotus metropolitanus]